MFVVRRIRPDEGPRLRAIRLAALADAPGDATTTLARAEARGDDHWVEAAIANASGGLQATFFAELADPSAATEPVGMIGAYANESGIVNLVGLWSAPGHRDVGVATALLAAVAEWAETIGADRLRMWVVERNEFAKAFYRNEGFAPTGATIPYELDPRLNQVAMIRPL
ncbi:GNAT family N-acetyltransferase [Aquihabitans sp. McL0605]|uniref:GNAT family N-acetyltransferase n=1 Tax=Aquihabitans sp. McL0605 TaxID=3415671 RepID=UPI003CFA416B